MQEIYNKNNSAENNGYVRVKINNSRDNKIKGFYLLMTNGNTYSDKKDEFIIEKKFIKLLEDNSITFEILPLNEGGLILK